MPDPSTTSADYDAEASLVGSVLADRYRVEALLGSGGMGTVYRAEHVHMRKPVALKVLHLEMTAVAEVVKRFEREALAAARIDHPNVANATDFGRLENGSFYLVLEYVPGKTLRTVVDSEGALPLDRAVLIARQIASALEAAHGAGVVHRDLKPDNVMLVERMGTSDFVKVLDFGIAKLSADPGDPSSTDTATQLTRLGTVFGTPQYMAPEQAAGRTVDHRTDLYALGLILHEMITGRPTFAAEELIALLTMQMTQPPPPLPDRVPQAISELVTRLLDKDPERRIGTATELVERFDALAGAKLTVLERATGLPPSRGAIASATSQAARQQPDASSRTVGGTLRAIAANARNLALAFIRTPAMRTISGRLGTRLTVRGRRTPVPVWTVAVVVLAAVLAVIRAGSDPEARRGAGASSGEEGVAHASGSGETAAADDDEGEAAPLEPLDPELERVLVAARNGQPEALYALQLRDEKVRTAREWLAMAIGRLKRRELDESLAAYEQALQRQPSFASDKIMLGGLRHLAGKDAHADRVLSFAAQQLGSQGADLLFHAWSSTSRVTRTTQQAKELLESRDVRQSMSPALRIAMALREAETCEEIRKLLPEVEAKGDERSLRPLKDLAQTSGCGDDGKADCYPCLREDSKLQDALAQARMRNAPRFQTPRRWRWR